MDGESSLCELAGTVDDNGDMSRGLDSFDNPNEGLNFETCMLDEFSSNIVKVICHVHERPFITNNYHCRGVPGAVVGGRLPRLELLCARIAVGGFGHWGADAGGGVAAGGSCARVWDWRRLCRNRRLRLLWLGKGSPEMLVGVAAAVCGEQMAMVTTVLEEAERHAGRPGASAVVACRVLETDGEGGVVCGFLLLPARDGCCGGTASDDDGESEGAMPAGRLGYVVYMRGHSHRKESPLFDKNQITESHYRFLGSLLGSEVRAEDAIFYSYSRHINGFAALLEEEEATKIANHPKVVSVFPDSARKLHTTRSWSFMGLNNDNNLGPSRNFWKKARYGEDTIIGNLDTGVWPESKSFSEDGIGPVPSRWKGDCQNENDPTFQCNRKLIGARYYNKGYQAAAAKLGLKVEEKDSPRDNDGHGTHTLSTAGGNCEKNASVFGFGYGTAIGGSPKARLVAYKVCWSMPQVGVVCFDSDILAAFDAAIDDGVDVLSVSIGAKVVRNIFEDGMAIGAFCATINGIVVVVSAGNNGPAPATVSNIAPWMITVAASTMDRRFLALVRLANNIVVEGESLSDKSLPNKKFYILLNAANANLANASSNDSRLCKEGTLDSTKVSGTILLCFRGQNSRVEKGSVAALASAVGMVLAEDVESGYVVADPHVLPAVHVDFNAGQTILKYINSTMRPMASISHATTQLNVRPAPVMAAFSSRGPSMNLPEILKPDVTAPGVGILAAFTGGNSPTDMKFDERRVPFNILSGTSVSCPHVSGAVGLLKTLYPGWTPAAIRSAIMTTAIAWDNTFKPIADAFNLTATPFSYGAGHLNPVGAMDPGLVYDVTTNDYLNLLCAHGVSQFLAQFLPRGAPFTCPKSFNLLDFNYPSITIPKLNGSITITRIVKNVGSPSVYMAFVRNPSGISVKVTPLLLDFKKIGEAQAFKLTLKVITVNATGEYKFGTLVWTDNKHVVKSSIVVKTG
ncbi:subtilisin-like protease SBT5.3 [Malania oleifera]|uniref:subtilisin-like protease SBT5.3 n=1 Tax=Malania oleifera TaxID=397392 RepID=UPI0025AE2BBE|nr:subtilisin-like protease SBT5.3 [Malania oleifera]